MSNSGRTTQSLVRWLSESENYDLAQKLGRTPQATVMSNTIHVLGVAHTVPNEDYLVCAFTAKILLFPDVIQPFGWDVIEYSNEGSASNAREHVVILTQERLRALSQRNSREQPLDADVNNQDLQQEFQRILLERIESRTKPGDIVCHVWGPNMEVYDRLKNCHHLEFSVGYTASPGLPFRVFESSAWMHWHYGKAGEEDGHNYKWVIPSPIDSEIWTFREGHDDYAVFLGRVTARKGITTLVEIARRMPDLAIRVYGPGDPSPWAGDAPANLEFRGTVFGNDRVDVVQRARCMLMPTAFIEPFGFSAVEAQLCGVPVVSTSFGAFHETIIEGVTGYRCHTLADWVEAIQLSKSLDRRQIAASARSRYSKEVAGQRYDWVLRQLQDLSGRGWYAEKSRKFAEGRSLGSTRKQRRIYLYLPYFGPFPNYFQLYLDSLGQNADCLSVFLLTDNDLTGYHVPSNLILVSMTLDDIRRDTACLMKEEFGIDVQPSALLKSAHKICDFRPLFLQLFREISNRFGVSDEDYVGWGDCDVIYGRFADFFDCKADFHVIGGYHGHLTAFRNIEPFAKLYKKVDGLPALLIDEKHYAADEIAFRQPLLAFVNEQHYQMFYTNRYFCDVVPECFFDLFTQYHAQRKGNFFEVYHPERDIDCVRVDRDGRLTILYSNRDRRQTLYCHLQKRPMALEFDRADDGYYIRENAFGLTP